MNTSGKYQPYKGYGKGKPWYWYSISLPGEAPRRIKVKGDWWLYRPEPTCRSDHWSHKQCRIEHCKRCNQTHCYWRCCHQPWKKWVNTGASTFEKRKLHRDFRRQAKALIRRELHGEEDVSHNFYVSGDWLD